MSNYKKSKTPLPFVGKTKKQKVKQGKPEIPEISDEDAALLRAKFLQIQELNVKIAQNALKKLLHGEDWEKKPLILPEAVRVMAHLFESRDFERMPAIDIIGPVLMYIASELDRKEAALRN